jgi:hypothetical protein
VSVDYELRDGQVYILKHSTLHSSNIRTRMQLAYEADVTEMLENSDSLDSSLLEVKESNDPSNGGASNKRERGSGEPKANDKTTNRPSAKKMKSPKKPDGSKSTKTAQSFKSPKSLNPYARLF